MPALSEKTEVPQTIALQFLRAGPQHDRLPVAYVSAFALTRGGRRTEPSWHTCTVREMGRWLTEHGFTWRPGSNGIWDAPRSLAAYEARK